MTPDEKRGVLTLLTLVVDELEITAAAGGLKRSAERVRSMRNMLGALGPYAKKSYTAPKLRELDAADVVEKLLSSLTVDEIRMVLGRISARKGDCIAGVHAPDCPDFPPSYEPLTCPGPQRGKR